MTKSSPVDMFFDPEDPLERKFEKLKVIAEKLIARVENVKNEGQQGYFHFERAVALEDQVRHRTQDLQEALDVLNATNAQLASAQRETEKARKNLSNAVEAFHEGFAIFDVHENIVMKNSRFLAQLPDVASKVKDGMNFEDYVKLSASSKFISFPNGISKNNWIIERLKAHHENRVNHILELTNGEWMQVTEQRIDDGGTIILQTDITDLVQLQRDERERMLDQQAQLVKETLDHVEQVILIFDQHGRLAEWNGPAIIILSLPPFFLKKGTRLRRFADIFTSGVVFPASCHPESIVDWLRMHAPRPILRKEMRTKNGYELEVLGREMSDGSTLLAMTDVTKIRKAHAELKKANETLEQRVLDRTKELKSARDAAQRANASKSRFVAAASHDLLQPINAAKLFISALQQTDLDNKQADVSSRIEKSFQSVETILGALLDISKLDSGKVALNICDFELAPIFERLHEEFFVMAAEKGLDLRIVQSTVSVSSDPTYLRRIIQNLVSNAVRYTQKGRVSIGVRRRKDYVDIYVHDTGPGIAPNEKSRIFGEFQRASSSRSDQSGMGLGLAIVERACQMLDHDLELVSTLEKGTYVRVSVPYAQSLKMESEAPHVIEKSSPIPHNMIAMVIENDRSVSDAMEAVLEGWGMTVIHASDFEMATQEIESLGMTPDIFIVDYHLDNDVNGIDVIRSLRQKHMLFRTILLTANRDPMVQAEATSMGIFVRYKPVNTKELKVLISGLLLENGAAGGAVRVT